MDISANRTPVTPVQTGPGWGRPNMQPAGNQRAQIEAAAKEFEGMFLSEFLRQGRDSSLAEGLLESSSARTFQGMLDTELARGASGGVDLGIAKAMVNQLAPRVGNILGKGQGQ